MPKSTTPVATATTTLAGKSAGELRALLSAKEVTAKAVIAHLASKETLRAPSKALLDELRGVKPAKAEPAKAAPAKAEPPKAAAPAKADKALAALVARVAALEAALAALAAPAPAVKVAPKVAAAKAAKGALAELLADEAESGDEVTEADMRDDLAGRSLADLREQAAACEIEGAARMGKAALVEALVEDAVLAGVLVTPVAPAAPAKAGKVAAKAGKVAAKAGKVAAKAGKVAADEVVF